MKRLYENVEKINIIGDVSQLSDVVTAMDISLQIIADYTDSLYSNLIRYSATIKSTQFERVVKSTGSLREVLFVTSHELNDMQNQVVTYQNKIYRYEDRPESAQKPNRYLVNKRQNVNVETYATVIDKRIMIEIAAMLKNYSEQVFYHAKTIRDRKNAIGSVWRDAQYTDFSEYIDGVTRDIENALKVFDDYVLYLEDKIKELD